VAVGTGSTLVIVSRGGAGADGGGDLVRGLIVDLSSIE
jgi:hypothetical protein